MLASWFALVGNAGRIDGAEAAVSDAVTRSTRIITNPGVFWSLPDAERQQRHRLRVEMVVYYYDPVWKLLWGESEGLYSYLPIVGSDLPIRSGQRVLLEGEIVPANGVPGESIKATVLAERAMPAPVAISGAITTGDRWEARWVRLEGYVCEQQEIDPTHLLVQVLAEGRVVTARLFLNGGEPVPQLLDMRVRVDGVYVSARDPAGKVQNVTLWIPRRSDIEVTGTLDDDARFNWVPTPIERLGAKQPNEWVKLSGEVRAYERGRSLTLRDDTGQVVVPTEQLAALRAGESVQLVGRVTGHDLDVTLSDPVFRRVAADSSDALANRDPAGKPLLKLRLVEQVMELRPDQAARRYPVEIKGVVTWTDAASGFFFLEDSSGGILVRGRMRDGTTLDAGSMLLVKGVSTYGAFAPEIEAVELAHIGRMIVPAARPISLEHALTGGEEGRRVELRGYLRQVERDGAWLRLDLTTAGGEFAAFMVPDAAVEAHVGALVRVAGVCVATANAQRQLTGVRLFVDGAAGVQVEQPAPAEPFAADERSIASLRQFLGRNAPDHRVRVAGCVLHQQPGRYVYLQDGDAGLLVLSRERAVLRAGEWVEAVGFPGREGSRLVLREAIWRRRPAGPTPEALPLAAELALNPDLDGRLVKIQAVLQQTVRETGGARLVMSVPAGTFEAMLDRAAVELPPRGTLLELTGVHMLEYDEYRRPRAYRIHLRSAHDMRVLATPSWWTPRRALVMAGGLGLCTVLGIGWVTVLRRRVNRQTREIHAQHERAAKLQAEVERTARLESLGLLAGGIAHDFNNLLTVVMANLSLAALDRRVTEAAGDTLSEAQRGAQRAAELTQQLLTFAKGGDPVRAAVSLPDVVREATNFALHGSNVRGEVEAPDELMAASVDRAQIGRVVHNLVLNATQAMPEGGVVRITLARVEVAAGVVPTLAAGRYVKLSVGDNGPGIAPENVSRIFDPYFSTKPRNSGLGLATVHSIVKKHHGHVAVESALGRGTVFHIWLPATDESPQRALPVSSRALSGARARVLVLDDEEPIRRSVAALLVQLGHEPEVASDGAEAIHRYRAASAAGRPFDVVVLDLTVPGGMGGCAALEALKDLDPQVKAIVSSGYSSDRVMANYRAFGFAAAVPKPYGLEDLSRAIDELMRGRKRERAEGQRGTEVAQNA